MWTDTASEDEWHTSEYKKGFPGKWKSKLTENINCQHVEQLELYTIDGNVKGYN